MPGASVDLSPLTALSPLDGRYALKTSPLRDYLSEYALIRYRTLVEVRWLQFLADESGIDELAPLDRPVKDVLNRLVDDFGLDDAQHVKRIEKQTNHDVKAIEYYLRAKLEGVSSGHTRLEPFLHFACTSEDINNLAYALMLRDARRQILLPRMRGLATELRALAHAQADLAMLSRTHGQAASPTTLGKEMANFVQRLETQAERLAAVLIVGKFNGAVGNYNAHVVAYPKLDWPGISIRFVRSLGVDAATYTTQIEPHDWIAEYAHALSRYNTVLIDMCRDIWSYISLGYLRSRATAGEVGSSTMPHKINPIDFENAEGNLGVANALLGFLADKLPVSRWQRDLTDSTVMRNIGVAVGHGLLALDAAQKGLEKLEADPERIARDLDASTEVLAEAVQTVMRRYGIDDAYEQLKALTRGREISRDALAAFIAKLDIPPAERDRLAALTPAEYIGLAATLARDI
ncbi:MAG TPA: adenylosuccinate lyase [Gammaproteobacteria bacterium]|nr:adenylosuccinate lyase [Gammaproteobacteria bacterium]